ncbi:MAG: NUDIX hydrolase [Candidatus Bathyarchaeota archaeon]|nr:NUDIX hydrolase [Candidatus Bathyarchaeota archaeon]
MKYAGKTATAIIPYPRNKILLVKRATPPFVGFWALPGGRCEPEEKAEQTILREVKEETGLDVVIIKKLGEYHEKGAQDGFEYDYCPACFVVKKIGGEIKRQESEVSEIKIFSLNALPPLAFEHLQMVKDYVASKRSKSSNSKKSN